MSIIDNIVNFENQPVSQIIYNMIKWFGYESVEMHTYQRSNVESGVWADIKIHKEQKTWYVNGQRLDIVKERLIRFLDEQNVRPKEDNQHQ